MATGIALTVGLLAYFALGGKNEVQEGKAIKSAPVSLSEVAVLGDVGATNVRLKLVRISLENKNRTTTLIKPFKSY